MDDGAGLGRIDGIGIGTDVGNGGVVGKEVGTLVGDGVGKGIGLGVGECDGDKCKTFITVTVADISGVQ